MSVAARLSVLLAKLRSLAHGGVGRMKLTRTACRSAGCASVLLVFAGCTGIDGAVSQHPVTDAPNDAGALAPCMLDELTPPPLVLTMSAGDQTGVQGSFCSNDDERGCGVCADSVRLTAKHFTIVHSGDQVTLSMPDGTLVTPGPDQCQPACPPQVVVTSLCEDKGSSRTFAEDEAWTIDLDPGVYQLDASASFSADELHGQTEETFGLIVDDARERGVVEAGAAGTTCGAGAPLP